MSSFCFELDQKVAITASAETGRVIWRAEYMNARNGYLVRYQRADGCAVEAWWSEDALQPC